MNKMMKTLKNKKGFTLVEILVVLIILAILAAVSIPAMLGFVNDAKGKAVIAEARAAYIAAQMVATEEYATNSSFDIATGINSLNTKVKNLLSTDAPGSFTATGTAGKVAKVVYTDQAEKFTVTITAGGSSTVEPFKKTVT